MHRIFQSSQVRAFMVLMSASFITACDSVSDGAFLAGSLIDGVVYMGTLGTVYPGLGPGGADLVDNGEFNSHFSVQEPNQELISGIVSAGTVVAEEYIKANEAGPEDAYVPEDGYENGCGGINRITCR